MKYIFDDIIKIENIYIVIEKHFDDAAEQEQMKFMIRDTIHHKLMDMVLDELDIDKRKVVLEQQSDTKNHSLLLEKLKTWIENFEDKLHLRARSAEDEMLKLIEIS